MSLFDKMFNALKPKSNLDSLQENNADSRKVSANEQPQVSANEQPTVSAGAQYSQYENKAPENKIPKAEPKRFNNQLEFEDAFCQSILEALEPDRFSKVKFKTLTLHTAKFQYAIELNTAQASPNFKKRLLLNLINGGINIAEDAEIYIDNSSDSIEIGRLAMGGLIVSLAVTKNETSIHRQAMITIVEGTGELEMESYILDSSHPKPYNIGRGRTPVLDNGVIRRNDIVIKQFEGNESKLAEINAYVSRSHASIICRNGNFFLKVNPHGLKQFGSGTKIQRGEREIVVLSDITQEKLENDDIIVLNKKVMLQFNIL